jgi:hypothetical protein
MPELGTYGSVRGALSNERPYRDPFSATGLRPMASPRNDSGCLCVV